MSTITQRFIHICRIANDWYQQQSVQTAVGSAQCIFGMIGIYNLYKDYKIAQKDIRKQTWKIKAVKIIEAMGNLSLVGGALASRPMLTLWRWTALHLFLPHQFQRFFSQRLYYIVTIANIILGLPSTLKTTYDAYFWIVRKTAPLSPFSPNRQFYERRTQLLVIINEVVEGSKFA